MNPEVSKKQDSRFFPTPALHQTPRVLVVDDEENVSEVFIELLTEKGYQPEAAGTGEEAVRKINEGEYDLVLTDINLPGVDGLEVVRTAKAKNDTTCVIVITGYASTRTAIEALRQGAYDYVTKPFDLWEVAQTIDRGLSSQRLMLENKLLLERLTAANEELKRHEETLTERIELATRRLKTLYEFGKEITSSLSLENTCSAIVEKARMLISCDAGVLFLMDEDSDNFVPVAESGARQEGSSVLKCPARGSHLGAALLSDAPTVKAGPGFDETECSGGTGADAGTSLVLPFSTLAERLGGLLLIRTKQNPFSKEDMEMLSLFGRQAAIALSNARLFERTKELDRLKSEFVAVVSHELRTPLTSIKGSVELLKDERLFRPDEKQKELLDICETNSARLVKLVSDILDFSKMESSKFSVTFEPTDIAETLRECAKNIQSVAVHANLSIVVDVPEEEVVVEADGPRIAQVVTNLLSNAIKFSEKTGTVRLYLLKREAEVEIGVQDQGHGIEPEGLKKLFQRFHQLDGSTTRRASGTGLGLVISKGIVEQHHGRFRVESELGKGSLFAFTIPSKQGWTGSVTVPPELVSTA